MNKKQLHANIHDALNLNSDPDAIVEHYKRWAKTYDQDVIENYYGIPYIVDLMHAQVQKLATLSNMRKESIQIVDVGCGTGLLGTPLHALGYKNIDGLDMSAAMLERARETGFYEAFIDDVNINNALPKSLLATYHIAICIGVFTPGHVLPSALRQLIAMTKSGGLVVLSTRVPYYDSTDFAAVSHAVIADGLVKLIRSYMDAPYRDDGDAHYWLYEVC